MPLIPTLAVALDLQAEDYRQHYTAVQKHHDLLQKSLLEANEKIDRL